MQTEPLNCYVPTVTTTTHTYSTHVAWQGSTGAGYRAFPREHTGNALPGVEIPLSADPHFYGDATRVNPEQLLVLAASSCQLLSFLAVAAHAGVDVVHYEDNANGVMPHGTTPMRIERIALTPLIRVAPGTDHDQVRALVDQAHHGCYIANSLTTTVTVTATVIDT